MFRRDIFKICAVFWRARRTTQNTNDEQKYIEDITRRREDMNFGFRVVKQYFTNESSEWVKYCFLPRENKIHIFKPPCNFLFII